MNATYLLKIIIWFSSLLNINKPLIFGKYLSSWTSGHTKFGSVLFSKAEDPLNNQTNSLIQVYIRSL